MNKENNNNWIETVEPVENFKVLELDFQACIDILRFKGGIVGTLSQRNAKSGIVQYQRDMSVNGVILHGAVKVSWVTEFDTHDKLHCGLLMLTPVRGHEHAQSARVEGIKRMYMEAGMLPEEAEAFYYSPYDYRLESYKLVAFLLKGYRRDNKLTEDQIVLARNILAGIIAHPIWSVSDKSDRRNFYPNEVGAWVPFSVSREKMEAWRTNPATEPVDKWLSINLYGYSFKRIKGFVGNMKAVFQAMKYNEEEFIKQVNDKI